MLTDKQLEELAQGVINDYLNVESELYYYTTQEFMKYQTETINEEWLMQKYLEMGAYVVGAKKIIDKLSSNNYKDAIKHSYTANVPNKYISKLNVPKVDITPIRQVKTTALESVRDGYLEILNKSYNNVISGTMTYDQSIKKSINEMIDKGFTGATYKRKDGTLVKMSMESVVRRDTLTTMHQLANDNSISLCKELDTDYVEVSSHPNARPSHADWQGGIYKLNGSNKQYKNFYLATRYGAVDGFGGANCKHRAYPYCLGDKKASLKYDHKEVEKRYDLEQKQRYNERNIRKWKQKQYANEMMGFNTDFEKSKVKKWQAKNNEHCKENNLRRDYAREQVANMRKNAKGQLLLTNNAVYHNGKGIVLRDNYPNPVFKEKVLKMHETVANKGYQSTEHFSKRLIGRVNSGKIKSLKDAFEVLDMPINYIEEDGTYVKFYNAISIHIDNVNGELKTIIFRKNLKEGWRKK